MRDICMKPYVVDPDDLPKQCFLDAGHADTCEAANALLRRSQEILDAKAAVWVSPRRQGGVPCIMGHRLPTATVAGLAWDGGLQMVRSGWPYLTDEQILGACWYEVVYGNRRYWRKHFPDWPREWNEDEWIARKVAAAS